MKIVTYNIHKARGLDGRVKIQRIADVLAELKADVIGLQEVYSWSSGYHGQVEELAAKLNMHTAFGRTRYHLERPYGNAILSRWPIRSAREMDISKGARERRGCIRVDLETPCGDLHVFNIHMGTNYFERRHQARALISSNVLEENLAGPRLLMGDFNEWTRGLATRVLSAKFESLNLRLHMQRRRTYPGILPFLHLDHIYFERPLTVRNAQLVRNRRSLIASDHLPLIATFNWEEG